MVNPYRVETLKDSQLIQAYSIVRMIRPLIDLVEWRQHVEDICGRGLVANSGGGVMGLVGPQDYIYGFYTYRAFRALGLGRTLDVNDFCVTVPASQHEANAQLLNSAEELAKWHQCNALDISFLVDEKWHEDRPDYRALPVEGTFLPAPPNVVKVIG